MVQNSLRLLAILLFGIFSACSSQFTEKEILDFNGLSFDVQRRFPYFHSGYDKRGAPIWIMELGKWDVRSAIEAGDDALGNITVYAQQMLLRQRDSGRKAGTGYVFIGDVNGFDIRQASHVETTRFWLNFFQFMREHFQPGDISKAYIVHTNTMFQTLWESASSVLGGMKNIFRVYERLNPSWIPRLLGHISPKELPSAYGGSAYRGPIQVFG